MSSIRFGLKSIKVKLYPGEPYLFINDPAGPVYADLDARMLRAQLGAERTVRVRTGTLLATIRKERTKFGRFPAVEVRAGRTGMKYTMVEHDGSPPHIIRARRAKTLRFIANGQVVFRKQVRHPGTTGTQFLTKNLPLAGG